MVSALAERKGLELAWTFAGAAKALRRERTLDGVVQETIRLAGEAVPGCGHASLSLLENRVLSVRGASDDVVAAIDAIQQQTGQGPASPSTDLQDLPTYQVVELTGSSRWPAFERRVIEETPVRSVLVLTVDEDERPLGVLVLYGTEPGAFSDRSVGIGLILACHASVALSAAKEAEELHAAVRSRDVIGQAKGMIRAIQHVDEDEAFAMLKKTSQRLNTKLRLVAEMVLEREGTLPTG